MTRDQTLARLEVVCGTAWFFDDGFWLMQWRWPCYLACVVAAVTAVAIFFYVARRPVTLLICGADTCWLTFNILWSVGDLEGIELLNSAAKVLFFMGVGFFIGALVCADKFRDTFALVLGRLRFFRPSG
jgi:hypothetical protein